MNWRKKMGQQFSCHRAAVPLKLINQSYKKTIYSLLLFITCCGNPLRINPFETKIIKFIWPLKLGENIETAQHLRPKATQNRHFQRSTKKITCFSWFPRLYRKFCATAQRCQCAPASRSQTCTLCVSVVCAIMGAGLPSSEGGRCEGRGCRWVVAFAPYHQLLWFCLRALTAAQWPFVPFSPFEERWVDLEPPVVVLLSSSELLSTSLRTSLHTYNKCKEIVSKYYK